MSHERILGATSLDPTMDRIPSRWRPIVLSVCDETGACVGDVMSGWRGRRAAKARHKIWHSIHERFGTAKHYLGDKFGFHHTSVMHGIRAHQRRMSGTSSDLY